MAQPQYPTEIAVQAFVGGDLTAISDQLLTVCTFYPELARVAQCFQYTLRPSDTAPVTAARALFVVDMASTQPQGCIPYAVAVQKGIYLCRPQEPV